MSHAEFIKSWSGEKNTGIILPDGWFGRPYDLSYAVSQLEESDESLVIVLNESIKLHFYGIKDVTKDRDRIVLGPFNKLHFEWTPFGGGDVQSQDYQGGQVVLVSAPG